MVPIRTVVSVSLALLLSVGVVVRAVGELDQDNVVAAWLLDEREGDVVSDATGHGAAGKLVGNTKNVEGKFGRAIELGGAGAVILIPDFAQTFPSEEVTIVAWVNMLERRMQELFSMEPPTPGKVTVVFPQGDAIVWQFGTPPQGASIPFDDDWTGDWHHWAFTHSVASLGMRTYLDGTLINHVLFTSPYQQRAGDFHIGGRFEMSFEGVVDDIAVFDTLLSGKDIRTLMEQGLDGALGLRFVAPRDRLVTVWADLKARD